MRRDRRRNRSVSESLPRGIYWIIVGLAAWLVLSAWGFAGSGYTGLALGVVSLFIAIAVGLPLVLAQLVFINSNSCGVRIGIPMCSSAVGVACRPTPKLALRSPVYGRLNNSRSSVRWRW